MRAFTASLFLLRPSAIHAALNLDGTQAVAPAGDGDPSPISDLQAYDPNRHDCPLPCVDYSNIHSWTPNLPVDRLRRYEPDSTILIRSCTLNTTSPRTLGGTSPGYVPRAMENPQKSERLFDPNGIGGTTRDVAGLLKGMEAFFGAKDNCDQNFLFAWHQQTAAGLYIGAALGKPTVGSIIGALASRLEAGHSVPNRTIAQLCGCKWRPENVFGVAIDVSGDLAALRRTALEWSKGVCVVDENLQDSGELKGARVFRVGTDMQTTSSSMGLPRRFSSSGLDRRATCRYIQVKARDSCGTLASRCEISAADFYKYNPAADLCSTLIPDDYVCCSSGDPRHCTTHLIQNGDTCKALAKRYHVTVNELEAWNKGKRRLYASTATPGGGPLVPGTELPPDFDRKENALGELNPCLFKACCSNWGFCGPFPAHYEIHAPEGGGPGSKLKGNQGTYVSNCGTDVKANSGPPSAFERIGYYESYNMERDCVRLSAGKANTDGSYTYIHWAFAEIDPNTWDVVLTDPYNQFLDEEGLDGVNIDWKYPGALTLTNHGEPIGQKGDGAGYLAFLITLKEKIGLRIHFRKSVPGLEFYLHAFGIFIIFYPL
ncbi:hypothetical protein C7999DRAFT_44272 [Corynascus novoguineensis]|uniref:LysM domain-containing protein n=1 Tax=Corynascus novoguineensis TaxID=1126955 RepID=A0AAN7HG24_9PEZI|nr:hypothetical protein C7999DRAFT_44272 [Corynascus novoguineensis]